MHVLGNVDYDPLLQGRYQSDFDFIPNLAMDLVVPWLAGLMPLDVAGRLFLAVTLLSPLAGVAWLQRVLFNRWSLWPAVAALFVYHGSLMAGLINFSLGAGLTPAALGFWIRLRHARATARLGAGSAMALALFFCHVVAFAAYGLLVIGYELARARDRWRRRGGLRAAAADIALAGATGLAPIGLLLRQLVGRDGSTEGALTEPAVIFGTWSWKAKALLAPLANYHLPLDLVSFALLAGLAVWAWRAGRLETAPRMVPGLGLLALAFLFAPKALMGGGVLDQRFAVLLALTLVAGTSLTTACRSTRVVLPAVLAALFLVRIGVLTATWIEHRQDLAEMRLAVAEMEPGSRVLVVQPDANAALRLAPRHKVFHHAGQLASLAGLAVIEKSAFVSTIFALPGQQPLKLKEPYRHLGGSGGGSLPTLADLSAARSSDSPSPQIRRWWLDFDYVLLIYAYGRTADALHGDLPLTTLLDGASIDLFRIRRDAGASPLS